MYSKTISILVLLPFLLLAQPWQNTFNEMWHDSTWGQGSLTPAGPLWSLDGMYDFDGDGNGEFLVSSSWTGTVGNDAILYEWNGVDAAEIQWYAWFNNLDSSFYNYSNISSGDLDLDGLPEIIVFTDAYAGQDALYIFEYDASFGGFPASPTASWNINLTGGVDEAGALQIKNIDSDPRPEILLSAYSRNPAESHFIIAELAEGSDLSNPNWHVELDNTSEMAYYSYLCQPTDLDQDGKQEILLVEWNYCRLIIFENTAEDSYAKVNDMLLTFEPLAFCNEGAAAANFDGDAYNELYLASTAGYVWVATNTGDVSQMTFANNFTLLKDYMSEGAYILSQLKIGNADSPLNGTPDGPDIYIAAVDTNGTKSTLFDLEFNGGDVTDPANYSQTEIFSDYDVNGDIFKVSKFTISDLNDNGSQEIILGSFGLDVDSPHIYILESSQSSALGGSPNFLAEDFLLKQNFPNPFNASTQIPFSVQQAGHISLKIFDVSGRLVSILYDEWKEPGDYSVALNANDLSSGYYYYELSAGGQSYTKKMILVK